MKSKKLKRLLELADIKGTSMKESSVRPTGAVDLIKKAANGKTYAIIRENRTYYIKVTNTKSRLVESDFDFIGGIQNKTKNSFSGFDDAVGKMNIIFNDINETYNIRESVDMKMSSHVLSEGGMFVDTEISEENSLQEKRFVLKQPKPKVKAPEPEMDFGGEPEAGGGDDFDFGDDESSPEGESEGGDDFDFGDEEGSEEGGDDFDFGDEEGGDDFDFGGEDTEGEETTEPENNGGDPIKDIQKTTGTLGQQLRDTEDLSSDMQKWVAKSVISALNLDTMDDADKDDVIKALETGGEESSEQEVDFMADYMTNDDRGGEPDLDSGEEFLLDGEDEGPGGYLGNEELPEDTSYMADRRPQRPLVKREENPEIPRPRRPLVKREENPAIPRPRRPLVKREENPMSYMTDDDMIDMEEGMSSWMADEADSGMGWEHGGGGVSEDVSYMDDEKNSEKFDSEGIYGDIYDMNNPQETPAQPTTKPGTDTPRPTRPSKSPFSPPGRIKPGEEPRPKAKSRYDIDFMAEPSPSQEPNESPTIAPSRPDTDSPRPTRPSTTPFTPPGRIKPGEETRPKADYDNDVTFE